MVRRRNTFCPVTLEPVLKGHQQLLTGTLALTGVGVAAESEIFLQAVRVGQALQCGVHKARVAEIVQAEQALSVLLLALARDTEARWLHPVARPSVTAR
jgi:hypothetical protein